MAALSSLVSYGSDEDSDESGQSEKEVHPDATAHLQPISGVRFTPSLSVVAAPVVAVKEGLDTRRHVDPKGKEIIYNPKYEELYAPRVGPENPFKTNQQKAHKNTLAGYAEGAEVSDFHFETQRRTFESYGYAIDPTADGSTTAMNRLLGDTSKAEEMSGITVFETGKKREGDKRKRERNCDPADLEGYLGPWAKYADEKTIAKPSEEEREEIDLLLSKRKKKGKVREEQPLDEKTTLHIKDPVDYQGRSFMHIPQDVGVNLKSTTPPHKCFVPKKQIHTWQGHTKGVAAIRWFPQSAHLLLSCSMDTKIKLWEVYNQRRCIRTYAGHRQAVRDISFNNDGTQFLSAGYDRYVRLWDTEKGDVISRFTNKKVAYCVKFNPEPDKQHLFVAGTSDKKIVCWDTRSGEVVQEYDRHLGAVNTITFVDDNRRLVSTSDDKSMRVWEWDVPVDMKYIADPSMHSMPAVTASPNNKWLACQSMDNQIMIFSAMNRFKLNRKKTFKGHMVAGYACTPDFSPEMSYLVSGDADGKVYIWDWKSTRIVAKWKAHDKVCISTLWHPHETSKLATAGWDGLIKYWD